MQAIAPLMPGDAAAMDPTARFPFSDLPSGPKEFWDRQKFMPDFPDSYCILRTY
jgi:hypothetical protein